MDLKSLLLKTTELSPVTVTMLGGEFPVRRLTAARLNQHDKTVKGRNARPKHHLVGVPECHCKTHLHYLNH